MMCLSQEGLTSVPKLQFCVESKNLLACTSLTVFSLYHCFQTCIWRKLYFQYIQVSNLQDCFCMLQMILTSVSKLKFCVDSKNQLLACTSLTVFSLFHCFQTRIWRKLYFQYIQVYPRLFWYASNDFDKCF